MEIHPRTLVVRKARVAMLGAVSQIQEQYGLTLVELMQILNEEIALTLKCMLVGERHPDNPCKGADEA